MVFFSQSYSSFWEKNGFEYPSTFWSTQHRSILRRSKNCIAINCHALKNFRTQVVGVSGNKMLISRISIYFSHWCSVFKKSSKKRIYFLSIWFFLQNMLWQKGQSSSWNQHLKMQLNLIWNLNCYIFCNFPHWSKYSWDIYIFALNFCLHISKRFWLKQVFFF